MPKATIVIATFRKDSQIPELIGKSLKAQTYKSFLLVIVDEHAHDRERKAEYKKALQGLKYKLVEPREPRGGRYREAMFRNTGLSHAVGEIVIFLDDLGTYPANLVEKHVTAFEESGKLATVIGVCQFLNMDTEEVTLDYRALPESGIPGQPYEWFYCSNASLPVKLAIALNGFDEQYDGTFGYADVDLGMRAHFAGHRFVVLKDCVITEHRTGDRHADVTVDRPPETNRAMYTNRQRDLEAHPRFLAVPNGMNKLSGMLLQRAVKPDTHAPRLPDGEVVRLAFVWGMPAPVEFWTRKRDSFQNAIAGLDALPGVDCRVFVRNQNEHDEDKDVNGQRITFCRNDNSLIEKLTTFDPQFICMAMPGLGINLSIINKFKGRAMLALYEFGGNLHKQQMKQQFELVDMIFTQQGYRKYTVLDACSKGPDDIVVIPHGVDTEVFHPLLPGEEKEYDVVMVADYREEIKRNHLLVSAVEQLPDDVRVLMIGRSQGHLPPDYYNRLLYMIEEKGLQDRIDIVNDIDLYKVGQLVRRSKIGVLTSSTEGGSRSLMEYMGCGIPCIVFSDCVGNTEMIRDGPRVCGVSVPPTGRDLANAITQMLDDEDMMRSYGANGLKHAILNLDTWLMFARLRKALILRGLLPPIEMAVITTSFNRMQYIKDCLDSVQHQAGHGRYFNIMHVVYDPGSTDGTVPYLKKRATMDPNLDLHIKKDKGQTDALVKAMKYIIRRHPKVEYIGWINADDYYEPRWATDSLLALEGSSPRVFMTFTNSNTDHEGVITEHPIADVPLTDVNAVKKYGYISFQNTVLLRANLCRRLLKEDKFVFNPKLDYIQDQDLWWRMMNRGYVQKHVPQYLSNLRLHPLQMSNTHKTEQRAELAKVEERRDRGRRILYVISNSMIGGMEMLLANRLSHLGGLFDIELLTNEASKGLLDHRYSSVAKVHYVGGPDEMRKELHERIASKEYGIVHVIGYTKLLRGLKKVPKGTKVISEFHIDLRRVRGGYWDELVDVTNEIIHKERVTCVTGGIQNLEVIPGLTVIPSAVDTDTFYPASTKDWKKVVWIGKPSEHKHIIEAGRIARTLIPRGYRFVFILGQMLGNQVREFNTEFEDIINTPEFHVLLSAPQERVAAELADAGWFLATYEHDCCSVALLEAMSAGCVTVSTNVGTIEDIVGESGRVVTLGPGMVDDIVRAFEDMKGSNLHAMSRCAREQVLARYGFRDYVRKHITMYTGWMM